MGRARYSEGYILLTKTNNWQANWFPYVVDPLSGQEKRVHKTKIVGTKPKMKLFQAKAELRKLNQPMQENEGMVENHTFGWFLTHRWLPLKETNWRPSTENTNAELLTLLEARFGSVPLKSMDVVEMQKWLKEIAKSRSSSAVLHLRTFLKSICAEAVDQDYLAKDPSRKLTVPKDIRPPDKTVLTWDQLRKVFAALSERDQLILLIEGTAGLRPSELFALRRSSFTGCQLRITETIYRGKLRPYGKTPGSLTTVDLAAPLAEQFTLWLDRQPEGPDRFIFANANGGFLHKDNYLNRVLYPLREHKSEKGETVGISGLKKLNFQILRRTFSTLAQQHGTVKDIQRQMRHAKPDLTAENYMQVIPESVRAMVDAMYQSLILPAGRVQ